MLKLAETHSLEWPIPETLSNKDIEYLFYPNRGNNEGRRLPDYEYVYNELAKPGVTLSLLWAEYCAKCEAEHTIPYQHSQFNDKYHAYAASKKATLRIKRKPGETMEVDWVGDTLKVYDAASCCDIPAYIFVAVLPCSLYGYAEAFPDMKSNHWIEAHIHAYSFFGGVTRILVPDNLKTGVIKNTRAELVLNRSYHEMAEHYGTAIMPCQQRKPRQKNSAENTVYNIALSIIAKLRNIEFRSFSEIRKAVEEKLEELNNEPFEKRLGSRRSDFEENERKMLRLLPAIPYKVGTLVWGRKVQPSCHVSYTRNWYSVPFRLLGRSVDLRITTRELQVFKKDRLVKRHVLLSPDVVNHYSTDPSDMPNGAGFVEWDSDRIMRCACSIGTSTAIVIERILASRAVVEQSFNNALAILRMTKRYNKDDVEKASEEALGQFASPRYHHLKAILASEAVKMENTSDDASSGNLNGSDYFKNFGGSEND